MTIPRALLLIALVVSLSCVMIMRTASQNGIAARLSLTEPAAGPASAGQTPNLQNRDMDHSN